VTTARGIGALPDIARGKPTVVRGFGMLDKVVFGRDAEGKLFFNGSGNIPENLSALPKPEEKTEK